MRRPASLTPAWLCHYNVETDIGFRTETSSITLLALISKWGQARGPSHATAPPFRRAAQLIRVADATSKTCVFPTFKAW